MHNFEYHTICIGQKAITTSQIKKKEDMGLLGNDGLKNANTITETNYSVNILVQSITVLYTVQTSTLSRECT